MIHAPQVFGQLAALADPTRSRLLLLLEQQGLSVSELCEVTQLPQSTVSRHLKTLSDDGWVQARSEGASRVYRIARLDSGAQKLWQAVRQEVAEIATTRQDAVRLRVVRAARQTRSSAFFAASASRWDAVRRDLFGESANLTPLLALLEPNWVVGDLGCGPGQVVARLAPFVAGVVGVDASTEMVAVARQRTSDWPHVTIREGRLEALPMEEAELDVALLMLVLHLIPEPTEVLAEVARVLRPRGRLLVVEMLPHDRAEYQETMGHVWQGISAEQIRDWCAGVGLQVERCIDLPPEPQATGPNLFAAVARRHEN